MPKKNSKRGRKPLWDEMDMPSLLDSVRGWALEGSTDTEICEMLGINHNTFYKWKKNKEEFKEALMRGKQIANGELINQAFREAKGYTYTEQVATPSGAVVRVERYARANPTMLQFMMKNRMPEKYKEKQSHEHSGPDGKPIPMEVQHDLSKLSDEELMQLESIVRKSADAGTDTS